MLLLFFLFLQNPEGYQITLELHTNSDWTELTFPNTNPFYSDDTLLFPSSPEVIKISPREIRVVKKAYDSTPVLARLSLFFPHPLPEAVLFSLRKGAIGKTELFLSFGDTSFQFSSQRERDSFSLRRDLFKNLPLSSYFIPPPQSEPLVLAFYYLWWDKNWFSENRRLVPHRPRLGFYSSSDREILRQHILMAKEGGIDGFILSWWGRNSPTDENLKKLIPLAESLEFKFTIYLEKAPSKRELEEDLIHIETLYAKSLSLVKTAIGKR